VAEQVETAASTVEEAVKLALLKLGATLDEVDIKIVDSGTPGKLLGLGAREARILVTRRTSPFLSDPVESAVESGAEAAEPAEEVGSVDIEGMSEAAGEESPIEVDNLVETATELLQGLVDRMGFDCVVELTSEEEGEQLAFNVKVKSADGEELPDLVGPRGENLRALGFVVNSMLGRITQRGVRVSVDVNDYRRKREEHLTAVARSAAESVLADQEPVTLEAMPPYERRLVHIALSEDQNVRTYSVGEGKERRVVVEAKA